MGQPTEAVWHKETALPGGTDLVILPGGFSYGDALRSGAIARFSPIMEAVKAHAERGGLVLGICNGFQVLLEAGLLEGAMHQNASEKFVCKMVTLNLCTNDTPFTKTLPENAQISVPVAHHEGRFYASEPVLDRLVGEDRIVFRYQDNPNGSARDIAGIVNPGRNVLGMMPHPERAAEPLLGSSDGLPIFESILEWVNA